MNKEQRRLYDRARNKTEHRKEQKRRWNNTAKGKAQKKNSHLYNDFGISLVEYNLMLDKQNQCCAICNKHKDSFRTALCVDHLHIENYEELPPTEKKKYIRGLLCDTCNRGIGLLQDKADTCYKAGNYLNNHQCLPSENKSIIS